MQLFGSFLNYRNGNLPGMPYRRTVFKLGSDISCASFGLDLLVGSTDVSSDKPKGVVGLGGDVVYVG